MTASRRHIILILLSLSLNSFGQKDLFNLPDVYYKIVFGQTTIEEVKELLGKPSSKDSKTTIGCMKYSRPVKIYTYKDGIEIMFESSAENDPYKVTQLKFTAPYSNAFAQTLKIDNSSYAIAEKELGIPYTLYQNRILTLAEYVAKETNRYYMVEFDQNKKLTSVLVVQKPLNLKLSTSDTVAKNTAPKIDSAVYDYCCSKNGVYRKLNDALKAHPDSVYVLFLGNNGLKEFPLEILKFKNLTYLSFDNFDAAYYAGCNCHSDYLSDMEYNKTILQVKENADNRGFQFPVYNKTLIKSFPEDIKQFKKLKNLDVSDTHISRQQITKLLTNLPDTYIETPYSDLDRVYKKID